MIDTDHIIESAGSEQLVRRPRTTDSVGRALRGVFATQRLPADMMRLIARLDTPPH